MKVTENNKARLLYQQLVIIRIKIVLRYPSGLSIYDNEED